MVSAVKIEIVLGEYTTEDQRSVVRFFWWAKGLNAKSIRNEMFPESEVRP
jgi:hypothetical protein